jgi:hypothetical protein
MKEPLAGNRSTSKESAIAEMLNGIIYELILRSVKSPQEGPRPYFAVAAIGYGTADDGEALVRSALPPGPDGGDVRWCTDLAADPLRIDRRPSPSGTGSIAAPVWVETSSGGGTPMCQAFNRAGRLVKAWVDAYPASFPPIIMNFTDGEATDGDPKPWSDRLRSLTTEDGPVLLFNLNLSSTPSTPILFPASAEPPGDAQAARLFEMSSDLPPFMIEAARAQGLQISPGARGFGFNADLRSVVTFMNVGTAIGRLVR